MFRLLLSLTSVALLAAETTAPKRQAADQLSATGQTAVLPSEENSADWAMSPITPVLYQGYGSVTVQADGLIVVRIDGDPPTGETSQREPMAAYAFALNTQRLTLVRAGAEYFVDRDGQAVAQRGLTPSDVSVTEFADQSQSESSACQQRSILEIRGNMTFDWASATGYGYVQVADPNQPAGLEVAFASGGQELPTGGRWRPWFCSIYCGVFQHCYVFCTPLYWAHCYCDSNGEARCECLPRTGGAGIATKIDLVVLKDTQRQSQGPRQSDNELTR